MMMMMRRHILRCKSFSPSSPLLRQVCEFSSSSPSPQPQPQPQPQSRCDDHFNFFGIHVSREKLSNYGIHLPPNAVEKKYDTEEEEHIRNEKMIFDAIIEDNRHGDGDGDDIQYAHPYHADPYHSYKNSQKKYDTEEEDHIRNEKMKFHTEEDDHIRNEKMKLKFYTEEEDIRNEKMKFGTLFEDDTLYYKDDDAHPYH